MAAKSGLLSRLFSSQKEPQELCCGITLTKEPASAMPQTVQTCCELSENEGVTPHLKLGKTELSANGFHVRRAQALERLHRNPYNVHFCKIGDADAIAVGRAPTPALNRVFGADLTDEDLVSRFNEWFARFHAVPPYQVLGNAEQSGVAPGSFGRVPGWEHVIMEKDDLDELGEASPLIESIEIEEIGKGDTEIFTRIYAEAFSYPAAIAQPLCRSAELLVGESDVLSYVASIAGEPVSVGQLYLSEHGAAFFGSTGTLPSARRSGCQALLDRRRILDAQKAGFDLLCRTVALQSQSLRNALKIGFRPMFREDIYAPKAMLDRLAAGTSKSKASGGCCSTELVTSTR